MDKKERSEYTIKLENNLGKVIIADEVIAIIAGLAAMEVEGVASMAGNATRELISKIGIKNSTTVIAVKIVLVASMIFHRKKIVFKFNIKC